MCPETDNFVAVVCAYCSAVVKPQGLQKHIHVKHRHSSSQSRGYAHTSSAPGSNSKFIASFYASTTSGTSHTVTITNATSATATANGNSCSTSAETITTVVSATTSSSSTTQQQMAPPILVNSNAIGQSTKGKNRTQSISNSTSNSSVSSSSSGNSKIKSKTSGSGKTVSSLQPHVALAMSRGGKTAPSLKSSDSVQTNTALPDSNSTESNAIPVTNEQLDTTSELPPDLASIVVLLDPINETPTNTTKSLLKKRSRHTTADQRVFLLKDRQYDPNKHCGVMTTMMSGSTDSQPRPCTRSLTCKTHALALRRHVQGRRCSFDQLLYDHRATKDSINKTNPSLTKVSVCSYNIQRIHIKLSLTPLI